MWGFLLGVLVATVVLVIAGAAWFIHTFKDMWG